MADKRLEKQQKFKNLLDQHRGKRLTVATILDKIDIAPATIRSYVNAANDGLGKKDTRRIVFYEKDEYLRIPQNATTDVRRYKRPSMKLPFIIKP